MGMWATLEILCRKIRNRGSNPLDKSAGEFGCNLIRSPKWCIRGRNKAAISRGNIFDGRTRDHFRMIQINMRPERNYCNRLFVQIQTTVE